MRGRIERQPRDDDLGERVAGDVDPGPKAVGAEEDGIAVRLRIWLASSVRERSAPWMRNGRPASRKAGSSAAATARMSV